MISMNSVLSENKPERFSKNHIMIKSFLPNYSTLETIISLVINYQRFLEIDNESSLKHNDRGKDHTELQADELL